MLYKTKGIVLNFVKYRETSIIVKIFTEKFGLKSYIVNSVRTAKGKGSKVALFQPFTLLDLVVYNRKNRSLHRISEMRVNYPFQSIPYHMTKSTICLFLTEILSKSVQEEEGNSEELFDFLENSIHFLDEASLHFENFHVQFLIKWSRFLGVSMPSAQETEMQLAEHKILYIPEKTKMYLNQFISAEYGEILTLPSAIRSEILDYILKFYALHLDNFNDIKSLDILRML